MEPNASLLVTLGIPTVALVVLIVVAAAMYRAAGRAAALRFLLGAGLWFGYTAALALGGVLADPERLPPPFALVALPTLLLPIVIAFSAWGAALARVTPLPWLVGFHAFRLPLELIMHEAARESTMPVQMTFTGANFDIVSGASALVVALMLGWGRAPSWLVWAWNLLGCALLFAVVGIAIASLPNFVAFGSAPERVNSWVAHFPFIWLPAGPVAAALLGHLVLWRRLAADRAGERATGVLA